jgi:hypothetical protein
MAVTHPSTSVIKRLNFSLNFLPIKIPITEPMMMAKIFRVVPNPGNI